MSRSLMITAMLLSFLPLVVSAADAALQKTFKVTVTAVDHDYSEAPVSVTIPAPPDFAAVALFEKAAMVPCQASLSDGKAEVTWIVKDLKKGQHVTYDLSFEKQARGVPASGVIIDKVGTADLDVRINNEYFTRYDTRTGPNKPYFYPLFGPANKRMVRRYPFEDITGETHDHPHHRGLWFTHGDVNGEDYWSEGPKTAKTVHTRYDEVISGPVYGRFVARTDWIDISGKKVAEDTREVTIYNVADGRLMDVDVTLKAVNGEMKLGDTKEGSFGLRLPDSMRLKGGDGHIESSTGVKDDATWGKAADWVDYYGTVDGATMGVAIFDHPASFRHPTTWHVRDYGLFAANPFGLHDFTNDKANPHKGDHIVKEGQTVTFRYRVFIHKGNTADAGVANAWAAYATPPKVEVR